MAAHSLAPLIEQLAAKKLRKVQAQAPQDVGPAATKKPGSTSLANKEILAATAAARTRRQISLFSPRSGRPVADKKLLRTVFNKFDADRSGSVSTDELGAMLKYLQISKTPKEIVKILREADPDASGHIEFDEFQAMLHKIGPTPVEVSSFDRAMNFANSVTFQTLLYVLYVIVFQYLAGSTRATDEYLFDQHVMATFVKRPFGPSDRTFMSIRHAADVYDWGNHVLWPGLFGDMGPCSPNGTVGSRTHPKLCNDDAWADGEGPLQMRSKITPSHNLKPTPLDLWELVRRMDLMDWSEGVTIRTARAKPQPCHDASAHYPTKRYNESDAEPEVLLVPVLGA